MENFKVELWFMARRKGVNIWLRLLREKTVTALYIAILTKKANHTSAGNHSRLTQKRGNEKSNWVRTGQQCFTIPEARTVRELLVDYMEIYGVNKWAMSTYDAKTAWLIIISIRLSVIFLSATWIPEWWKNITLTFWKLNQRLSITVNRITNILRRQESERYTSSCGMPLIKPWNGNWWQGILLNTLQYPKRSLKRELCGICLHSRRLLSFVTMTIYR